MTDQPSRKALRGPRVFAPRDAALEHSTEPFDDGVGAGSGTERAGAPGMSHGSGAGSERSDRVPAGVQLGRGLRWGALFFSAAFALGGLATGLWFARFISVTLERDDWVGWAAFALVCIMVLAAGAIMLRELFGLMRLSRLRDIRSRAAAIADKPDLKTERGLVREVRKLYRGRRDLAWAHARMRDYSRDITDPGDLLRLLDRELMAAIDREVKAQVARSAKRVAVFTALSPAAVLDVIYVLAENLRLLRQVATLYGGRPGFSGSLRLGRLVVTHIIATGGLAITDDLFGQFLGQDLVRRLSRRLGEGAFNGALTARLGVAAIEVCRPIPFIEAPKPRFRELAGEAIAGLRPSRGAKPTADQ